MKNTNLNKETVDIIQNLQKEIERLKHMESNIEVSWRLEWMINNNLLQNSANAIKKSVAEKHGIVL